MTNKPPPNILGPRIIKLQRATVLRSLLRAHHAWKHPLEHSAAHDTLKWAETRPDELRVLVKAIPDRVEGFARVADEHTAALSILIGSGATLPVAGMTLVRSTHEAVIQICWLSDPGISPAQRALRAASLFVLMVEGGIAPLRLLKRTGDRALARVEPNAQNARGYLRRAGFTLKTNGDNRVIGLGLDGEKVGATPNLTELTKRFLPGDEYLYALGSGAAHARDWLTSGLEGPPSLMTQMVVLPILALHDALTSTCSELVGLNPDTALRDTHRRRISILQYTPSQGAIGDWKHYREQLLDPLRHER